MPIMFGSHICTKSTAHNDESLVKQLTDLIRQNVTYSKRLDVLGILSYTTDNGLEKFIKIDSSFGAICEKESKLSLIKHSSCEKTDVKNMDDIDNDSSDDLILNSEIETIRSNHSSDASPPLLPPSVLHVNRAIHQDEKSKDYSGVYVTENHKQCNSLNDAIFDENGFRRYRRKCRQPKRQIVDANKASVDSELEDAGSDGEDSNPMLKSRHEVLKFPRLSEKDYYESDRVILADVDRKEISHSVICNGADYITSSSQSCSDYESLCVTSNLVSSSGLSLVTLPCAPNNKFLSSQSVTTDAAGAQSVTSTPKYAITAKTLGLDFGELCGFLPVNSLLNKTLISNTDSSLSSKLFFANCSTNSGVSLNAFDSSSTSQINQPLISNSNSTQNIFLNSNLAAAVAAVISNSNNQNNTSSLTNLNTHSIALTGPSGEILGTIPIAAGNPLSSGLANSHILNQSLANSLSAISVTMPINVNAVSSPGLASTLSWLRCATNLNETSAIPLLNQVNAVNTSSSLFNSSNPVSLLQSLVNQQQQQQQQNLFQQVSQSQISKQHSMPVGPTLALIGTLGLNSTSITNTNPSSTFSNANMISINGSISSQISNLMTTNNISNAIGSLGISNVTTTVNSSPQIVNGNNGAALVAAALLKSLTNPKLINPETIDLPSTHSDNNHSAIPGSVTLIANSLPSINLAQSNGTNVVSFDDQASFLSQMSNKSGLTLNNNSTLLRTNSNTVCTNANSNPIAVSRNSIMLSYPRGTGEVNLVLAPASMNTFTSTTNNLSSLAAVPTAFSFPNCLSASQATNLTIASPLLLHTQSAGNCISLTPTTCSVTNTLPTTTTVTTNAVSVTPVSTTCGSLLITNSTEFTNSSQKPGNQNDLKSTINNCKTKESDVSSDPTASAIDRILQTIKGCMNQSSNRESDIKIKNHMSLKKSADHLSSNQKDDHDSAFNTRRHITTKIAPNLALKSSTHTNQTLKQSKTTNHDRLPIPSLHKSPTDLNETHSPIPISKVYRCRYCGKTFNRKFCRERHERLHTGVKPYTCEICDEKFIRLEDKKRHVRSLQHYLSSSSSQNLHKHQSPTLFRGKTDNIHEEQDDLLSSNIEPSNTSPLLETTVTSKFSGDSECTKEIDGINENNSDLIVDPVDQIDVTSKNRANDNNGDRDLKSTLKTCKTTKDLQSFRQEQPSADLLNNLRLSTNNSNHHRTKLCSELSDCKIGIKIPTVVIVSTADILKQTTDDA